MTDWPGQEGAGLCAQGAEALARHLAAAPSVTAGLLTWCAAHGIGQGPVRVLARSSGAPPPALADLLGAPGEAQCFRRVVLGRGGIALVEADNLYLPARLPVAMRQALAATDTPFGAVIAPLLPRREEIDRAFGADAGPGGVLAQVARVRDARGRTLAVVAERFLLALLARR